MSDCKYVEIPFEEFKYIEKNYREVRTVFDEDEEAVYRTFVKDSSEIILKYKDFYNEEDGNYYIVYKKIPVSH